MKSRFKNPVEVMQYIFSGNVLWVRYDGLSPEVGHSMLYALPHTTVLRHAPERSFPITQNEVAAVFEEFGLIFGWDTTTSFMPRKGTKVQSAINQALKANPHIETVIFEGYLLDSTAEQREEREKIATILRKRGYTVLLANGHSADFFHNKPHFRTLVKKINGDNATPRGVTIANSTQKSVSDILKVIQNLGRSGLRKVILKMSGAGGLSNLILSMGDLEKQSKIKRLFETRLDKHNDWLSIEEFVPFESTYGLSFWITDEQIMLLGIGEQVLNSKTNFVGARSYIQLSSSDQKAIVKYTLPIIKQMQQAGISPFGGVDIIVGTPYGLPLPSGRKFQFIEASARWNGFLQERFCVGQVALRNKLCPVTGLAHMRVGAIPPQGLSNRKAVQQHFEQLLSGRAIPLNGTSVEPGNCYFLLDSCHGDDRPTIYDAVLFMAHPHDSHRIDDAVAHLQKQRILKI